MTESVGSISRSPSITPQDTTLGVISRSYSNPKNQPV